LILFTSTILILSYLVRIFELPYFRMKPEDDELHNMMDNYFNALWLIVITLTTVGYGDVSPCTNPGRLIAMISALWGAFLISLLVLTVGSVFELQQN
jgi:voltage-gated potassium channel